MRVSRWFMASIIIVTVAGSSLVTGAAEKIGRWTNPPQVKWGGTQTVPGLQLSAAKIANTITATSGQLRSQDGVLTASANIVTVEPTGASEASAIATIRLDGEAKLMVKIKDQSDISATASKGQIEWGKRTIELKGAVTITSTAAGETQPTTIKCDSAVIRWSEKLEDGQTRIKVEGTQVSVESSRAK